MISFSRRLVFSIIAALSISTLGAETVLPRFADLMDYPQPDTIDARSIVVMEFTQGNILFEFNSDDIISPASLTKIMTMYIAQNAARLGKIDLYDRYTIQREEVNLPYRSSLMYLREGMNVYLDDLLRGMSVVSGNDAAFAVARIMSGTNEKFAFLMNTESKRLGLNNTFFVEPSGLSEYNLTNAMDMARFARIYISEFPEALASYHSRLSMEFPREDVMPPGESLGVPKIVLRNINGLLFNYDGFDGLKTGYIDESGYNLIATAERDGSRFIVVTMGGKYGASTRDRAARQLLDWAFENWMSIKPGIPQFDSLRIWGSKEGYLEYGVDDDIEFTSPKAGVGKLKWRINIQDEYKAPIKKGEVIGSLVYSTGDLVLARFPLTAMNDVNKGNIFVRIMDTMARFFKNLFR